MDKLYEINGTWRYKLPKIISENLKKKLRIDLAAWNMAKLFTFPIHIESLQVKIAGKKISFLYMSRQNPISEILANVYRMYILEYAGIIRCRGVMIDWF